MQDPGAYGTEGTEEKQDARELSIVNKKEAIGVKYGVLLGQTDVTPDKAALYFNEYQKIHELSTAKTATHLGQYTDPDFVPYWNPIEAGYKTFESAKNDPARQEAIQLAAQELFGFYESFPEYIKTVRALKTEYKLLPFKGSGQIINSDEDEEIDISLGLQNAPFVASPSVTNVVDPVDLLYGE